jgi:8-oxo-dGTP diphosphatase
VSQQRFKAAVAVHLFLVRGNQILLLRRQNTGYQDGNYSVVAGHLDGGEQVRAAAIREAREEAGIVITPADLSIVGVMHRTDMDERIDFFVTADKWSGEIVNAEPEKCSELAWYDLNGLPENVIPYVRQALQNYRDGVWFDSVGW